MYSRGAAGEAFHVQLNSGFQALPEDDRTPNTSAWQTGSPADCRFAAKVRHKASPLRFHNLDNKNLPAHITVPDIFYGQNMKRCTCRALLLCALEYAVGLQSAAVLFPKTHKDDVH
ncbi:Uncharacterised protein [Streptococcus pneumoniae]|nr:Uncharacterised protein [Streptococcus pneumoniae]